MRVRTIGVTVVALALSPCLAQQPDKNPAPNKPDPAVAHIEELKIKAERKDDADRGRLYADIAHQLVELANAQFTNGESDKGQVSIKEAVNYAEKSANSADMKGHK